MTGLVIATGPHDPRMYDVDDDFRKVLVDLSGLMVASATRRARFFHGTSVATRGTLRVLDRPAMPPHAFFRPGRVFDVIGRYSNSQGTDDVHPTVRGLTVRLLDRGAAVLDLTFNTGERFFADTAENFRRAFASDAERTEILAQRPEMRSTIWSNIRTATAYPEYDFHSQVPQAFVAEDGTPWLVRYRVLPMGTPVRAGHFDHGDRWWPPDAPNEIERPAGDHRPATVLRAGIRDRIAAGGVTGVLQVQLHPLGDSPAATERALDASRAWELPWLELAHLRLDEPADDAEIDTIAFDPGLAPPELGVVLSRSPHSTASLNHLRCLLYRMASLGRLGRPMPRRLSELLRPVRQRRTVCVLGAGVTGLTAARELEAAGHRVIVLEAAPEVAGKCASVEFDGHVYDLGGHICTSQYHRLAALATELGVPTEPTTPYRTLTDGRVGTPDTSFFRDGGLERYRRLRAERFPEIGEPGLAHCARELAAPLSEWLAEHDLRSMADSFGPGYTAAGYGHLADDPPALYFVKYAELTGLLSDDPPLLGHAGAFTVSGGFGRLWQAVARGLSDVRRGVTILAVTRHDTGVVVHTDDGVVTADDLIVTVPVDQVLAVLDATDQERRLAELVRYQDYRTTLITAGGLPESAFHFLDGGPGHCVALHHRYPGTDVHTAYSYGTGTLAQDVEWAGGRLRETHLHRAWRFMPHLNAAGLATGALEELEALQGVRHTYYAGSLYAFELVECNIGYAQQLVHRFFGGATTTARAAVSTGNGRTADEVRQWLVTNIAAELAVPADAIDPSRPLESYALDSVAVAALQAGLSDYLGARVPHTLFLQVDTIDAATRHLLDAPVRPAPTVSHLLPFTPTRPFFCVGGIGGSAAYLRPLATALGPAQPFYALELPGQTGAEEAFDEIEQIAKVFVDEIRQVQPIGPYRLGGHSFGGLVAYEMGRQLRAAGADVAAVVVLDTYVPVPGQPPIVDDDATAITELLTLRHEFCVVTGGCGCQVDRNEPLAGQGVAIAKTLGGKGDDAEQHLLRVLRLYQASLRAYAAYTVAPSDLTVRLVVPSRGLADHRHRVRMYVDSPANGWEHVELGDLTVIPVDGGHFGMFLPPQLDAVATAVRGALA